MRTVSLILCCLLAGAGRVDTRASKTLVGDVSFEDRTVVVKPESGEAVRVGIDDVKVISLTDGQPQPMVAGKPWGSADVGTVAAPGSMKLDRDGVATIEAAGWGLMGGKDSLYMTSRPLSGDGQIIAHVRSARGGVAVIIRQNGDPNAAMAALAYSPAGKTVLHRRLAGRLTTSGAESASRGETWLRLTRRGNRFTAFDSSDGRAWRQIDQCEVPMTGDVVAGIGAWTGNNAGRGETTLDSVSVIVGTAGSANSLNETVVSEGAILTNGVTRAGAIASANGEAVTLASGDQKLNFVKGDLAGLILASSPKPLTEFTGRTGVVLANGDFIEGDVSAINLSRGKDGLQGKVLVTSVVFGPTEFEVAKIAAVVLRDVTPSTARYQIRTTDGSVLYGNTMEVGSGGVTLDGSKVPAVATIEDRKP